MDNPRRFLYNGGKDMGGGALLADGLLLAVEADDLFALETPLRQMMAGFAAEHGFFCGVSRPYGGAAGVQKADRSARTALRMAEQTGTPCVTDDPAGAVRLLESASPAETEAYIHRQLGAILRQPEPRRSRSCGGRSCWIRWTVGCAVWATSAGWHGSCTCTTTP